MSYRSDREWADQHLSRVKDIVGPHLLVEAPFERDRAEATDLIVLRARDMTIGVRLRRRSAGYWLAFPDEFTIRCKRDTGAETELSKIIQGWGDWLFYGHADDKQIDPWMLIDLAALRQAFIRHPALLHKVDRVSSGWKSNRDGTYFAYFNRKKLPPNVTLALSEEHAGPIWDAVSD